MGRKLHLLYPTAGVNVMLRKIAVAAASKPAVEIKQDGESFYIKTFTTVRTTEINFKIGEEFEEQTVDGRPCKSLVKWENQNKMVCEQRLLKGEGPKTSWSRELTNDGELILVSPFPPFPLAQEQRSPTPWLRFDSNECPM
uniref:Cellular retinoic acid binding protein 2 n=1 Tax=Vombatus ursinus TaxID=29139 RepID=A0A4X2L350_VOMUR